LKTDDEQDLLGDNVADVLVDEEGITLVEAGLIGPPAGNEKKQAQVGPYGKDS
jgi:hypothetical protein